MGKEHFEEISIVLILFKRRIEIQTYVDIACSPGQNTGVGSLSLLQGIFSTQRSNPGLPHCRRILYQLSHKGSPIRFSHGQLFATLWTVSHQAPLTMGFSRQGHWSGLPYPPPGDLPNPRIEPTSLTSPALAVGFFTTSTT